LAGLLGGLLIGGFVLTGCTAASTGASSSGLDAQKAPANAIEPAPALAPDKAAAGGTASGTSGGAAQSGGTSGGTAQSGGSAGGAANQAVNPLPPSGRAVIRSASISLAVPDVNRTAAQVRQITTSANGYTGNENAQNDQADFTLQVPVTVLDQVVDRIAALGHVTDRTEQAQDVTDQLVDVQSRVASQQASVDRVRALLAKATSVSDIVTIEGELATRESDLESLEQRQAELSGQVAMSTLKVHIGRSDAPPPPPAKAVSGGFVGGLAAGWHSFVAVIGGALVVIGAVLPYLLGLGVPAAAIWWYVRRRRGERLPATPVIDPDAG
jgi:hypothetical protein